LGISLGHTKSEVQLSIKSIMTPLLKKWFLGESKKEKTKTEKGILLMQILIPIVLKIKMMLANFNWW
ncbi:hypothetical protein ACJX0J_008761, partial [Zea mays]